MTKSDLLDPLRERDFARLWTGQVVSDAGDWVNYVALTALVWNLTGSAWMVALLRACHAVPLLIVGPFAGVFIDRWDRRVTLIVVDVLRAGLVLLFVFAQDVTAIFAITILFNVVATFFSPAKNAIIPRIVSPERLLQANSLSSTTRNMAMVIGPAIGGAILAVGGTSAAFFLNSATFLFSAAAIATISTSGRAPQTGIAASSAWSELAEGVRFSFSRPPVRAALILEVGLLFGWGCINVLAIVIAEAILGGGATEYGLLLTSIGLGSLAGAAMVGGIGGRFGLARMFPLGFAVVAVAIGGLAGSTVLLAAATAYFLAGAGRTMAEVSATTIYQKAVPDELRGRIFSLRHMITHLAILTGNQLAGLFTDAGSIIALLLVSAVLQGCCAVLSALWLSDRKLAVTR